MGVYIPNMEKPKSCWECPLYDSEYPWTCDLFDAYCPLIDIVTCRECIHWYNDADCGMACEFTNMGQPSDGFCNWGERRTETLDERIKRGLKEMRPNLEWVEKRRSE